MQYAYRKTFEIQVVNRIEDVLSKNRWTTIWSEFDIYVDFQEQSRNLPLDQINTNKNEIQLRG